MVKMHGYMNFCFENSPSKVIDMQISIHMKQ